MASQTLRLFIAHSPFQHLIASHMVDTLDEFTQTDNVLILDSIPGGANDGSNHWTKIVALDPPVGRSVLGSGSACRQALRLISGLCEGYTTVELFRANLAWPLNNALQSTSWIDANSEVDYCNYPEGIGSLVYNYPSFRQKLKNRIKHVLGVLGGTPHYAYAGDIMGLETSRHIYSLLPSALRARPDQRVTRIPAITPLEINPDPQACIFLGQNYDLFMANNLYAELCERAAVFTRSLGYSTLYYKPHHYDVTGVERTVFENQGFTLIQEPVAIERVFLTRQVACVVSYASSALVNLKLMFPHDTRCISCFSDFAFKHSGVDGRPYRALFEQCGVEIYNESPLHEVGGSDATP